MRPILSLSLSSLLYLSLSTFPLPSLPLPSFLPSCSFLRVPHLTILVVLVHLRPRDPYPFRTTQTRGAIRRGLRARHSDDRIRTTRGMSNNIHAATVTDDEAAARNSAARFAFFSLLLSVVVPPRDML